MAAGRRLRPVPDYPAPDHCQSGTCQGCGREDGVVARHGICDRHPHPDAQIDNALGGERVAAALAAIFGALASVLAFLGVYGLLAFAVQQRIREIGVRMALGATRRSVVGMIASEGMAITLAGVALGVPLALSVGRLAAALLYGVTPFDAPALVAAASGLLITGFIAGLVPAVRAVNANPMDALRSE